MPEILPRDRSIAERAFRRRMPGFTAEPAGRSFRHNPILTQLVNPGKPCGKSALPSICFGALCTAIRLKVTPAAIHERAVS